MKKQAPAMFLDRFRAPVSAAISRCISFLREQYQLPQYFLVQLFDNLENYTLRGKLIRGSLIPFTYYHLAGAESTGAAVSETDVYSLAAAMELFQSMLLIHDDIMDHDDLRRGKPSIHALYAAEGQREGLRNFRHYGECMGICIGDIATFLAFDIVARLECDPAIVQEIVRFFSRELVLVGMAQMQDVRNGEIEQLEMADIINTYRHKTGRYTFSLPMSLAALLHGLDATIRSRLELLGEYLGIIFQIRDDELGLFGDPAKTGKPGDSDLKEGKKTVVMQFLLDALAGRERAELQRILQGYRGGEDRERVYAYVERYGVRQKVDEFVQGYEQRCREIIGALPGAALRGGLEELLRYNLSRGH